MVTQKTVGSEGVRQLERAMRVYNGMEGIGEPTLDELAWFMDYIQELARKCWAAVFLRSERCPVRLVFFPSGGIYEYQRDEDPSHRKAVTKEVLLGVVRDNLPGSGHLSGVADSTWAGLLCRAYCGEGVEFFFHHAYSEAFGG